MKSQYSSPLTTTCKTTANYSTPMMSTICSNLLTPIPPSTTYIHSDVPLVDWQVSILSSAPLWKLVLEKPTTKSIQLVMKPKLTIVKLTTKWVLFTGNIQGLVSKSKGNKCLTLDGIAETYGANQYILAVTESWLRKNQHHNAEVLCGLKNHRILRTDRDTNRNPEEEGNLSARGGCAIIATPNIIVESKVSFSNGNCELLIAELAEMKLAILLLYIPPLPNFLLSKFEEVMEIVGQYLTDNAASNNKLEIILTGDFNFPKTVVEWTSSDDGPVPTRHPGSCGKKLAFDQLTNVASQFCLQ